MIDTVLKIDETYSERRSRPESTEQYKELQRTYPRELPATHTWDYRWEDPTPQALSKNRYLLPELVRSPRELTLSEISAHTKNFETLGHGELRFLFDKHKMKVLSAEKGKPAVDEIVALREAIRLHFKANPQSSSPNPKAIQQTKPSAAQAIALPDDIARMGIPEIDTEAAILGFHDEFKKQRRDLPTLRGWLANKRAEKAKELVSA